MPASHPRDPCTRSFRWKLASSAVHHESDRAALARATLRTTSSHRSHTEYHAEATMPCQVVLLRTSEHSSHVARNALDRGSLRTSAMCHIWWSVGERSPSAGTRLPPNACRSPRPGLESQ